LPPSISSLWPPIATAIVSCCRQGSPASENLRRPYDRFASLPRQRGQTTLIHSHLLLEPQPHPMQPSLG
jgi:hypothetical protein